MSLNRRVTFEKAIEKLLAECTDDAIATMDLVSLEDSIAKIERLFDKFELEHLSVVGDSETPADADTANGKYLEVDNLCQNVRRKLRTKFRELQKAEEEARQRNMPAPTDAEQRKVLVEVQNADPLSSVTNTWGTFEGDYSKWHDFRDRFKAGVHDNPKVVVMHKYQLLKKAMVGSAARVLGSWQMTEANYQRAWERLCSIYEDDYLAIQTTVRKLLTLKPMQSPSYKAVRGIVDTVYECLNQLAAFVTVEEWHSMIMFMVVDLLDQTSYEQWETCRQSLTQPTDNTGDTTMTSEEDQNADDSNNRKAIPKLTKLLTFLDQRARILMHAERREETNDGPSRSRDNSSTRRKPTNSGASSSHQSSSSGAAGGTQKRHSYPLCMVCGADHALHRCPEFMDMYLDKKMTSYVNARQLCHICLRSHKEGECTQIKMACTKCKGKQYHNTLICPTREAEKRATMMSVVGNNPTPITFGNFKKPNKRGHERDGDRNSRRE